MSGPGIVLNETSGTMLGPDGRVVGQLGARAVWSAVMDAQRNIFAITAGDGPVVTKFDPTGSVRWKSAPFRDAPLNDPGAGPILGDGTHVFFVANLARSASSSAVWTPTVAAIDVDTGTQTTMWPFEGSPPISLVLTPAAQLVFTVGTDVVALSSGGERPPTDAPWPTARGAIDQRSAALGQ
jgi:hypothetical protein